jgi:hypothetical protein
VKPQTNKRDMQAAQRKKKKKKQKVKVGSVISVYWPEDKTWYHGEVISFNDDDASEICEVLYEDGEREVIKLKEEKYKIGNKARGQKLCRLLADGDVNAQLTSIREILYDIGTAAITSSPIPFSHIENLVFPLLYEKSLQIPSGSSSLLCTFCMLG